MKSGHFLTYHVNWATPIIFVAIAAVLLLLFTKIFEPKLMEWGFSLQKGEIEVDEDLPNFFTSVKLSQADEVVKEEENMRKNFGILLNDPDTIEKLDNTAQPKKAIQGTPWYTVLSNIKYQNSFNYIGAFIEEREKLIEDGFVDDDIVGNDGEFTDAGKRLRYEQSDMVMILLNLAVIPDEVVKAMHF